ncbi:YdeI/OmpD-associated family protein [Actinophytocola sp. S1-96]|uniref:YdeI/OmpD-associated family protein n=1 Tax=Actinophytocola gossypii TaxID=2812003 RepID=A0ABT2JEF0_9PSEU|nr:YdeI/OmpD-associated family protein [Actinophytocola gossypii]
MPELSFATQAEFAAWLAENAETRGLWIRIAKKGTGIVSVDHDQALAVALRHGWIDGQARRVDDDYFVQRFTPRTKRSRWSKINRDAVERMIEAGEMAPRGLREVEAAKADGRWEAAYAGPASATVPDDLRAALDANPAAAAFFTTLTSQNRYAILFRVEEAKRPETRARRIEKFVAMLERGETIH